MIYSLVLVAWIGILPLHWTTVSVSNETWGSQCHSEWHFKWGKSMPMKMRMIGWFMRAPFSNILLISGFLSWFRLFFYNVSIAPKVHLLLWFRMRLWSGFGPTFLYDETPSLARQARWISFSYRGRGHHRRGHREQHQLPRYQVLRKNCFVFVLFFGQDDECLLYLCWVLVLTTILNLVHKLFNTN